MKNIVLIVLGVVVVGAAAFGVYSFTKSESDDKATSGNYQVQDSSDNATEQNQVTLEDQTVEGALVEGFPGDKIPLYRGDVVESKRSTDSQNRPEYNVRIETTDSFEKVDDWTRTSYVNEGWKITTDKTTPSGGVMLIAHSDGFINAIAYKKTGDVILINYGISTK